MCTRLLLAAFSVALAWQTSLQAGTPLADAPRVANDKRWAFSIETAQLLGVNNPRDYHLAPQILSLAYLPRKHWMLGNFEIRSQILFSAIAEAVLHGPENHYLATALRRRWTCMHQESNWGFYVEGGFAVGAIDSTGDPFGQGQDLTFSFLLGAGLRYCVTERMSMTLGVLYQHLSNGGLSEPEHPNTGLDAFGPSLGIHWLF